MLKRKDGSVSQRGLWDNIRDAKGSGKKPTAAMLKQEKKIKETTKKEILMAIKKKLPKAQDGGAYTAWKNGKLTRNYGGSDAYINKSMDTTGYSKGKQEFDFNRSTFNNTPGEGRKTVTTKVSRKDVPSKIAELKKNSNRTVIESKKKANSFTITENKPVTKSVKKPLVKAQKGKQVSGMYDFQNIYTGPDSTSPGVLKAKADKKKADANLLAYKKKAQAQKQLAIKKAQTKKK